MAEFERGQTFLDLKATNYQGTKGKYYIGLSNADYDDDVIVCFVFNTENRMDNYHLHCNDNVQKFIVGPATFSFIEKYSSIMLNLPCYYSFKAICNSSIKLLDKANDELSRQIKNCIDWSYIPLKFQPLIKQSFK